MIVSTIIFTIVFFLMLAAALFLDKKAKEYEKKYNEYNHLMNKPVNVVSTRVPRIVLVCGMTKEEQFIEIYGLDRTKKILASLMVDELANHMWFTAKKDYVRGLIRINGYVAVTDEKRLHYDLEEALDAAKHNIDPGQQSWR